ncbi:MAG: MotA/TolQ/ExbB proton channel family protein [Rickettsiales bacterium]|nr:MotA/TolQ/ExbB proton channel family protein [Rickettsiales bacterium]
MSGAYSVSLKNKSIFDIIIDADIVVQIVIAILLLASIWSWSIIINKILHLRSVKQRNTSFLKTFHSQTNLKNIFETIKDNVFAPIEFIFVSVVNELNLNNTDESESYSTEHKTKIKNRVHSTMLHSKNKSINELENSLGYLATIAAVTPFIGLFGTVWGIMKSFQAIAFSKNTSLAVVAPGIAEALFATALGLVAAIPALMFYNILSSKINSAENIADDFLVKLNNKIEKSLKL